MNLYRDGQFVETFDDPRDYETLVDYVSKHARPTGHTEDLTPEEQKTFGNQNTIYNPTGTVSSLDETTFQEVIGNGHAFVKFFAPWYVPSSALTSRLLADAGFLTGVDTARNLRLLGWTLRDK